MVPSWYFCHSAMAPADASKSSDTIQIALRMGLISLLADAFIYFCLRTTLLILLKVQTLRSKYEEVSKKLQNHFSQVFQGDIWQQSLSGNHLLLTIRDQEQLKVSFSLVELSTGDLLFEGLSFEEDWWISTYHFFENTIVFQVYEDSQDMDRKHYFALDIETKEIIWELDKVQATGRHGYFLQLKSMEAGEVLFYLDIRSGETFSNQPEIYSTETISDPGRHPLHYVEEGDYFDTMSAFGTRKLGKTLVGACDYLEYQGLIFLAFHYQDGKGLTNELVVLDPEKGILLQQTLCEGLAGLTSGAFFIVHEQLIFVEGKNTLNSFRIQN